MKKYIKPAVETAEIGVMHVIAGTFDTESGTGTVDTSTVGTEDVLSKGENGWEW